MLRSLSNRFIARGVAVIALGVVAVVWPSITVGVFVFVFAAFAFADALVQLGIAFSSASAKPAAWHMLIGSVGVGAGVVAVVWAGITALALVLWMAVWAVVTGAIELGTAFADAELAGERTMWAVAGGLSVGFGIVLFAHPTVRALALAMVFGVFALPLGLVEVASGISLRRTGRAPGDLLGGSGSAS